MIKLSGFPSRSLRIVALAVASWLLLGAVLPAFADGPGETAGDTNFLWQVFLDIIHFDSHGLMLTLRRPECTVAAFVVVNVIVFVETGLLLGFFLPGDSLLVTAGVICAQSDWNLGLLLATVSLSAIVGDSLGYAIGFKSGPKIFCRQKSLFFNKNHLLHAQAFYEKHGGKTIILARFMPILRTFAPVVAGVGRMEYRRFLFYNIIGGLSWVCSMVLLGYVLPGLIEPLLAKLLGRPVQVQDHIEKVIIVVVFLSVLPGIVVGLRNRLRRTPKVTVPEQMVA